MALYPDSALAAAREALEKDISGALVATPAVLARQQARSQAGFHGTSLQLSAGTQNEPGR